MRVMLHVLGWLLLIVTIGLASCQTLLKAAPQVAKADERLRMQTQSLKS